MASHGKKVEIDLSKGYEKNDIELKGIIITVIALFLTCVVSFWLMYVLQTQAEDYILQSEKQNANPMALNEKERLPPEPRLQAAPGFGVDSPTKGRINLELKHPQAEWQELQKMWAEEAEHGQKLVKDGKETIITLPIAEAKKQLLAEGVKSAPAVEGKNPVEEANAYVSSASAGRKTASRH